MKTVIFKDIEIGCLFKCNQTLYKKRSTRTAELINLVGRVFYFGKTEVCKTVDYKSGIKNKIIQKVIYDIQQFCQDIDQWYEKAFLIPALKNHLEKWHESDAIDIAIKQCFTVDL